MNDTESRIANRLVLAAAVLFFAALFWVAASAWVTPYLSGKLWLTLVAASVLIADRGYVWLTSRNAETKP